LALGVGLAFLLEMRDKSIRTEQDIEALLGVPTLAQIPMAVDGNGRRKRGGKMGGKVTGTHPPSLTT
jgi:hypothetical protein